ncbi:MAG: WD40/YVTN/BNR-like repeat-containing protein, partial [Oscillospiraceae bacterium]
MTQKYLLAISVIMICVAAFVSPVYAQSENEWFQTNEGMDGGVINDIVFNPQNSNVLYAATKNGLYITENGGEFWFQANKGFTDYHVNHIAINPHMPEQIYVATKREGVFRSN